VAKVRVDTDGHHGLPAGTVAIVPSIRYLERAYDAAKYGEVSQLPYLEVTTNGSIVSIHFQFAPYSLRNADWNAARGIVEQRAIETLDAYCGGFKASVKRVQTITPHDLETTYGLSESDLNHGQLILDQIFFMRPLPGWSNHKTPIDGLYLCGAGVHGGGGISGASGRNAAKIVGNARIARDKRNQDRDSH
jgi:phytoene dehydrogenase-like protein